MPDKKNKFHSSVNLIPVIRTPNFTFSQELPQSEIQSDIASLFSDKAPETLDHLGTGTYSGQMRLRIKTMTALVFGQQTTPNQKAREVSIYRDPESDNPLIPATMVKGMIANAYERVTASRFRIFDDHSEPLTYRADPAATNSLIPIRLNANFENGTHTGKLLYGPNNARFAKYFTFDQKEMLSNSIRLKHGDHVKFRALLVGKTFVVTEVWDNEAERYSTLKLPKGIKDAIEAMRKADSKSGTEQEPTQIEGREYHGWFYATTPDHLLGTADRIIDTKRSERIFFDCEQSQIEQPVPLEIAHTYDRIILSYAYNTDEGEVPPEKASRFVFERNNDGLIEPVNHNGLLAYARIDTNNKITEILPTEVGRRNYSRSPRDLARSQQILPATELKEASPGDRLFGFTADSTSSSETKAPSLRGRIYITNIDTSKVLTKEGKDSLLKLRPLISPKPSSARRFLTDANGITIGRKARSEYYSDGQLLGASTYPFSRKHAKAGGDGTNRNASEWNSSYEQDILKDHVGLPGAKVQTKILSWIPRDQHFFCTLRFEGISRDELRILLLLTSPDLIGRYAPTSERFEKKNKPTGFLRMGMGKPFELGIVKVSCVYHSIYQNVGDAEHQGLADDYKELAGCLGAPSEFLSDKKYGWDCCSFINQAHSFYELLASTPSAKAFLRTCIGYPGTHEVRYMKLRENRWNNQTNPQTGMPKDDNGVAPRSLIDDQWTQALEVGEAN